MALQGSQQPRQSIGPATPPSLKIVGVPIARTDYPAMVDWIAAMIAERKRGYVCVCNVHSVMAAREDAELREALDGSSVNVPDGQPLVWAMNALGVPLRDRVYGPELMLRACARAAIAGQRFYLYGGRSDSALARLTVNLRERFPGLVIVGGQAPPHRALTEAERSAVAQEINRSNADVVWVGIGVPKQEKWMAQMRPVLDAPVLIGVGAAFDFYGGLVRQAPPWMQARGLEWAYRLVREPRRLWRRYFRYNPRFLGALAFQLWTDRRARDPLGVDRGGR